MRSVFVCGVIGGKMFISLCNVGTDVLGGLLVDCPNLRTVREAGPYKKTVIPSAVEESPIACACSRGDLSTSSR